MSSTWWAWRPTGSAGRRVSAPGCAAAYFPEANVLVPLDSVAEVSKTPASKSVVIRLELAGPAPLHG